jgi:hypothetical protein
MSLDTTIDITEDSGLDRMYFGQTLRESATRVAQVGGLAMGSSSDAEAALSNAMNLVQQKWPVGTKYKGAIAAIVVGYRAMPIPQSSETVKVLILYDVPSTSGSPGASGGDLFVVSDDTVEISETSQFFFNAKTKSLTQLVNTCRDPQNPQLHKDVISNITYEALRRRLVFEGTVLRKDLSGYRAALRCVNGATWYGLPIGFWRLSRFSSRTVDLGRSYRLVVEFVTQVEKDWSKYEAVKDRNTGQYVRVAQKTLDALAKKSYAYGVIADTGIMKVGPYLPINFTSLFGNTEF